LQIWPLSELTFPDKDFVSACKKKEAINTIFRTSPFVFHRRKELIQAWDE